MKTYAFKNRKIQENYLRKHCDRGKSRQASEASSGNCLLESREIQEEVGEKDAIRRSQKRIQQESSSELLALQDIPRKQSKRKRKEEDTPRDNEGVSKTKRRTLPS